MNIYEIHPLQTARTIRHMQNLTYLRNYGRDVEMFYGAFLIKNDEYNILVDTGCDAESYAAGKITTVEDVASIEQNLNRFSLTINDIDALILTHMHFDHVAFLKKFTHCPVFLQETEYNSASSPHPYFSFLYVPDFYKDMKFELTNGDKTLFPGINVAFVPGHSAGSQAVIVNTQDGKTAVSGFCCVAENFDRGNFAIPGIHENIQQAYESMNKLASLADFIYPNHSACRVKIK
ncbi:MAG: N-acyl homoserine lactonase family protein [Spirochaetes bacterium]|nr:N-acyl homoserine lactonase family protein [Spirochaetota bacterium]